jgi:ubiquinone/menaquinone biosynthesis C-methylase UbiE
MANFSYFDAQASWGISKPHYGGLKATLELLRMCHLKEDYYVLDVGCGAGITSCYISERFGCRVVGVDLSEKMLSLAKERARRKKIEKTDFKKADAQDLPFEDGTFDLVISESVVSFVKDKEKAIKEYARVVKAGGYVGINEAIWLKDSPPSELDEYVRRISGAELTNAEK